MIKAYKTANDITIVTDNKCGIPGINFCTFFKKKDGDGFESSCLLCNQEISTPINIVSVDEVLHSQKNQTHS